ncbi:MAG: helix-hairpin-helix domain-containing protein [Acidobacteriota bacterium]
MNRFVVLLAPLAIGAVLSVPARAQTLPDGEGRDTYETVCGACHGADIVLGSQGTKARWEDTVDSMKNRGASGSDADFVTVVKYLSLYFGPSININTAAAKEIETELDFTTAQVDAIVKARTAAKIADFAALTKVPGMDAKKLEPLKTRLKF